MAVETVWDAANVAMGVGSFMANVAAGNVGGAALDAVGVILDSAATVTPCVPGGAGTAIKLLRGADKAADLIRAGDKANEIRKVADRGAELANSGGKLNDAARSVGEKTAKKTTEQTQAQVQAANRGKGGRGGGSDHAAVQQNVTDAAAGRQEVPVEGTRRIADNVDNQGRIHQIGDMRTRGGKFRPSSRERGAIEDIREGVGADKTIIYHDKKGVSPSLINPDQQPSWKPAAARHRKPVEKD